MARRSTPLWLVVGAPGAKDSVAIVRGSPRTRKETPSARLVPPAFAPRPKWRLERIIHHELTPDHPPPVRLTFYQRAANNRWRRYRAQQLVSPPKIDPELARQRRQARDRQRRHRARVAAKRRTQNALTP